MSNDVIYFDIAHGELVIIVNGTPCNVEINAEGIRCTVWGDEADAPHSAFHTPWTDIVQRATPL